MKNNLGILVFLAFLVGTPSIATNTEIFWVRLEKIFSYRDIDRFCTTKDMPTTFLFGAELVDDEVRAAVFKYGSFEPLSEKLPFTSDELKGIKFNLDKSKRKWIESIDLNARQLNWIFTRGGGMDGCVPTQPLATLGPNDFTYEFNLSEILVDPQITSSLGKFSGKRKDGRLYQSSLALTQKLMQ